MQTERDTALQMAHHGDTHTCEEVITTCLPLVYNLIGRALNGHRATDTLVEDTMVQAVLGAAELHSGGNFRSWLTATAMDRVWEYWQGRSRWHQQRVPADVQTADAPAAPVTDFVDLTVFQLDLAGQHLETAKASRWLGPADQIVLSLWWLECGGELTPPEVAAALQLSTSRSAVRVQQMKRRLDTARVVVRALETKPPCPALHGLLTTWDGIPDSTWRIHIALHIHGCVNCSALQYNLYPSQALLTALPLLPPPPALTATIRQLVPQIARPTWSRAMPPGVPPIKPRHARYRTQRPRSGRRSVMAGTVLALAAAGPLYLHERATEQTPAPSPKHAAPPGLAPAAPSPSTSEASAPSASPSASVRIFAPSSPYVTAPPRPSGTARTTPPEAEKVIAVVNQERTRAGCGPLTMNARLTAASQNHSTDMVERGYFGHVSPDGKDPGERIAAAGYRWSTYGENIARGRQSPAEVMHAWMNSPGPRANILNCSFTQIGIGIRDAAGGPRWTQTFAAAR